MAKIIRLTENDLASIVRRVISEATQKDRDIMSDEFVKSGKLTEEELEDILSLPAKANILRWLARLVTKGYVESFQIKSFGGYLTTFESVNKPGVTDELKDIFRNKGIFTKSFNITELKTPEEIESFISACDEYNEERGKLGLGSEDDSKGLLNPEEVNELNEAGIPLLGVVDGYQIFKVSSSSDESYNAYRKILLQCSGGLIPSSVDSTKMVKVAMCTTGRSHFDKYLRDNEGSSYYVIYKYGDPESPYQFFYEDNQFKNRENKEIF
jgi:hypothetical protein